MQGAGIVCERTLCSSAEPKAIGAIVPAEAAAVNISEVRLGGAREAECGCRSCRDRSDKNGIRQAPRRSVLTKVEMSLRL